MPIGNSLGFMIFKTLTASNLLAALLIQERNNKMKDRIMLSGIKTGSYIGGSAANGDGAWIICCIIAYDDLGVQHNGIIVIILVQGAAIPQKSSVCLIKQQTLPEQSESVISVMQFWWFCFFHETALS